MTIKEFFSFRRNTFFWLNIIAMVVLLLALPLVTLHFVDSYTHHGEAIVVPDVKGMTVSEARSLFAERGLSCVIADSSYVKERPAGCILDYHPAVGQRVKMGRTIYLTVNTLNIPLQSVPDIADNSSLREAEARVLAAGFRLDEIEYMPGERDWVYGVKYQGRELGIGEKVPMGATLTLLVGDGGEILQETDSLGAEEGGTAGKSEADESWF